MSRAVDSSDSGVTPRSNSCWTILSVIAKVSLIVAGFFLVGGGVASYFYWEGLTSLVAFSGSGAALIAAMILYQCITTYCCNKKKIISHPPRHRQPPPNGPIIPPQPTQGPIPLHAAMIKKILEVRNDQSYLQALFALNTYSRILKGEDKDNKTLLHYAVDCLDPADNKSLDILKKMLTQGADPNHADKDGLTPTRLAFNGGEEKKPFYNLLVANGGLAQKSKYKEKEDFKEMPSGSSSFTPIPPPGPTLLDETVTRGIYKYRHIQSHLKTLFRMYNVNGFLLKKEDKEKKTLLQYAIDFLDPDEESLDILKKMLTQGADPNHADKDGLTPTRLAFNGGEEKKPFYNLLVANGGLAQESPPPGDPSFPPMSLTQSEALDGGAPESVINLLVANGGLAQESPPLGDPSFPPMSLTQSEALDGGAPELVINLLVANGGLAQKSKDEEEEKASTPPGAISFSPTPSTTGGASEGGLPKRLHPFLEKNRGLMGVTQGMSQSFSTENYENSIPSSSSQKVYLKNVKDEGKGGALVNSPIKSSDQLEEEEGPPTHLDFLKACMTDDLDDIDCIIDGWDMDPNTIVDKSQNTVLHLLANRTDPSPETYKIIRYLIEKGASLEIRNINGKAPLHLAVLNKKKRILRELLKGVKDVNIQDKYGQTPLHYAVMKNSLPLIQMLTEQGASVTIEDKSGESPFAMYERLWGTLDISPDLRPKKNVQAESEKEVKKQEERQKLVKQAEEYLKSFKETRVENGWDFLANLRELGKRREF